MIARSFPTLMGSPKDTSRGLFRFKPTLTPFGELGEAHLQVVTKPRPRSDSLSSIP